MKCTDCECYYLGCDTEVFNYGYEEDKAEECDFFTEVEIIKFDEQLNKMHYNNINKIRGFIKMREIKFRAWDKHYKRFRDIVLSSPISALNNNEIDERFELTQYTGLKDKNGKEIYEADIVQFTDNYNTDIPPRIGVVKFNNASFYITDGAYSCYRWIDINVEIIGNIYENPELI